MNFENIVAARKAITDKHGYVKPQLIIQSEMACPICTNGQMSYQISPHNGHIHAQCSTPDCVRWME